MLDQEDLKWIASASTELNAMLQQISRYTDLARQHKGEYSYLRVLGDRVEVAARKAQALFDHVTSSILNGSHPSGARANAAPSMLGSEIAKGAPANGKSKFVPSFGLAVTPVEISILNPTGERELILLVDDDAEISEIASTMLTSEGYRVILAADGSQALRIYEQIGNEISLVILDFFLPVMDGDAVFEELRALNPEIAVVLSSGFAEQTKVGAMLAQGLRGFLPKPYTSAKLLEQVRSILDHDKSFA